MSYKITLHRDGAVIDTLQCNGKTDVRTFLALNDIFLDSPCAGRGRCGKCAVKLTADGENVLACQTEINRDMDVYLPVTMDMEIAGQTKSARVSRTSDAPLGVAIDVGTTTVVAHLTDLVTRERLATSSGVNAQRVHGADVVSRIEYSAAYGHEGLTRLIQTQINGLIADACKKAGADARAVTYIVIAGNTIMQHLAAGYSPAGMGTVPFEPVSLFGEELPPWDGLGVAPDAKIFYAPCVSSYVGGDITAGFLACGLELDEGPTVFIDIGTNGEITMKLGDKYLTCATAAGPAFEGAEIERGMAAITGAINHVRWDGELKMSVIGGAEPDGLCGSGLLDALAMLLETGVVDETGRMMDAENVDHPLASNIGKINGKNAFYLSRERDVFISAADVRKLQLAKAAIAGGIQTLLRTSKLTNADIKTFILAGGFGSYMDKDSAARIGLFPCEFLAVTRGEGNTAGEGAAIALCSPDARAELMDAWKRCEYIELSSSPIFNDEFVENMMFPDE